MLINNRYNFLFVHIQKTGGTSVTENLIKIDETKRIGNNHSLLDDNKIDNIGNYFKFCFVRNPWDRLVSWYNMIVNKGFCNDFSKYLLSNSKNFSEFIDLTEIIYEQNKQEIIVNTPYRKSLSFNQLDYVSDNRGKILVDFIGKFENINEDYYKIMDIIGIDGLSLPHLNKFAHEDYRTYYKDKDIEKVYELYKRDINYFEYNF